MKNVVIGNLKHTKKTLITLLISIITAFILVFITTFIFSSVYTYMVDNIKKEKGDFHVKIKTNLYGLETVSKIKKIKWEKDYVYITYNNIKNTYQETKQLCKKVVCKSINYNEAYLSIKGVSKNKNMLKTFKYLIIVVLLTILISTSFIIYNIYKICLYQKYKQISILKSIGTTNIQIIKMLIIENLIICLIALLISIILSILIIFILTTILNNLLKDLITFKINIKFLSFSIIFILLLVLFITLIPIVKLNKTPLKITNMEYKNKKINENNILVILGKANYKRSKSHYKPVIISLVICTFLYSTFSILLNYTTKIIHTYVSVPKYDTQITYNDQNKYETLNKFGKENASKYKIYKYCTFQIEYNNRKVNLFLLEGNNYFINKSETTILKNNKIIRENKKYYKNKIQIDVGGKKLNLKENNTIPYGFETMLTKDNLIAFYKDINIVCEPKVTMFMKNKTNKKITADYYVDMKKGRMLVDNMIFALKLLFYSIIILTLLVGISSIITASFLSMEYRKKEFGILKSIGFSKFNELITLESIFIAFNSFIISFPLVTLLNFITNEIINNIVDIKFTYFYKPLIFCLLISIILIKIVMSFLYKKYEKANIVDLIYNERI